MKLLNPHPNLIIPAGGTELWRYMDVAKLIHLLEFRALWLARLDTLGDPYEGMPTRPVIDGMWESAESSPAQEQKSRLDVAEHNTRAFQVGREALSVSCWHASDCESAAMWSQYGRIGEGIAVRTSLDRLVQSIEGDAPSVFGGMVQYVDFETYRPLSYNLFDWATLKRKSFAHEHEFRLISIGENDGKGVLLPVSLSELIVDIRVAGPTEVGVRQKSVENRMSDIEARSNSLLRTAAARQATVDRLLGRTVWNGFVFAIAVPMIVNVVFLLGWVVWAQSRNEPTPALLGGVLVTLLWVSVAVVLVASRLRALATVMEQSGALTQFVVGDAALSDASSQEAHRPAG